MIWSKVSIKLILVIISFAILAIVHEYSRAYLSIFFKEEEPTKKSDYLVKPVFNYLTTLAFINLLSVTFYLVIADGLEKVFMAFVTSAIFLIALEALFVFRLFTNVFRRWKS